MSFTECINCKQYDLTVYLHFYDPFAACYQVSSSSCRASLIKECRHQTEEASIADDTSFQTGRLAACMTCEIRPSKLETWTKVTLGAGAFADIWTSKHRTTTFLRNHVATAILICSVAIRIANELARSLCGTTAFVHSPIISSTAITYPYEVLLQPQAQIIQRRPPRTSQNDSTNITTT